MWDDGAIWEGARQHRLVLRACSACGTICHPPLPMCPECQSLAWDERNTSGKAVLRSWFVSLRTGQSEAEPRIAIVVELDEGPALVSNIVGAELGTLHEGMALELTFAPDGELTLPVFRPAGAAT
jgi:uncharacterized OB-fold protein